MDLIINIVVWHAKKVVSQSHSGFSSIPNHRPRLARLLSSSSPSFHFPSENLPSDLERFRFSIPQPMTWNPSTGWDCSEALGTKGSPIWDEGESSAFMFCPTARSEFDERTMLTKLEVSSRVLRIYVQVFTIIVFVSPAPVLFGSLEALGREGCYKYLANENVL